MNIDDVKWEVKKKDDVKCDVKNALTRQVKK